MADVPADRRRRAGAVRVAAYSVLVALGSASLACGRDGFEDRTAVVQVGAEELRFQVDACGLDESTLFVVGRSGQGETLQVVLALEADGATGIHDATGFTVDVGSETLSAFGSTAWTLRNGDGDAPGSISSARLRGARIQIAADAETIDAEGGSVIDPSRPTVRVGVDVRCDQRD